MCPKFGTGAAGRPPRQHLQPGQRTTPLALVRTDICLFTSTLRTCFTIYLSWSGNTTHSGDLSPFTKFVPEPSKWRAFHGVRWRDVHSRRTLTWCLLVPWYAGTVSGASCWSGIDSWSKDRVSPQGYEEGTARVEGFRVSCRLFSVVKTEEVPRHHPIPA